MNRVICDVYISMIIIYTLIKLEQFLCKNYYLKTIYSIEYYLILPIYLLPLNRISYLLLCVLFVLSWMDRRLQSISDRLIVIYFCVISIHYFQNPIQLNYLSMFICLLLMIFAKLTNGIGMGDIYILFGLTFILNSYDFMFILRYSFFIALVIELIKKTKKSFAFVPYIYYSLILFLSVSLY